MKLELEIETTENEVAVANAVERLSSKLKLLNGTFPVFFAMIE